MAEDPRRRPVNQPKKEQYNSPNTYPLDIQRFVACMGTRHDRGKIRVRHAQTHERCTLVQIVVPLCSE